MFIFAASVEVSVRSVADIAECLIFAKQLNIFYYECDDNYAAGSRRRKRAVPDYDGADLRCDVFPDDSPPAEETERVGEVHSNVAIRVDKNMVMRDPSDIATPAK